MKTFYSLLIAFVFLSVNYSNAQCTYTLACTDTFGDAWQGGRVAVSVDGTAVVTDAWCTSAFGPTNYTFTANDDAVIRVYSTTGDSYESERRIAVTRGNLAADCSSVGTVTVIATVQPVAGTATTGGVTATASCQYNFGVESAAITANSSCSNGTIPVGSGAYKDVTIAAGTYYNFTAPASFGANSNGMRIQPLNGSGNGGTVTLSASQSSNNWYSGTTTSIRVSTRRSACFWNATSATLTYRNSAPNAVTVSGGGAFCTGLTTVLTASGGGNGTVYWQNTTSGGTSTATASTSQAVSTTGTFYFRSNNNGCWGTQGSASATSTAAPGNPATFGSNTWNVYAYNGGTIELTGVYSGFYTEPLLSYNTINRWASDGTPSSASGFSGCGTAVPIDNHCVVSKRQGFTCGVYQINVPSHDDGIRVYINGVNIWNHEAGCCDAHSNIWTGYLTSTSTIEVRHLEGTGGSNQELGFVTVTPTLAGGTIGGITDGGFICSATDPGAFTNSATPSGGTIGVDNGSAGGNPASPTYQWESSTTSAGSGFSDINLQNGLTYDPGTVSTPTWYRRKVTDACGSVAYSNVIKVDIFSALSPGTIQNTGQTICYNGDPSVIGSSSSASGGNGSYTYEWRANGTPIGSTNSTTYDPPSGLIATTTYTRWAKEGCLNTFVQSTNSWIVTVRSQFNPGSILETGQTICNGGTPTIIGNNALATGGDASFTYSWRSSADSYAAAIGGATSSTYTPPSGLTTSTSYRRYARDGTCNITPEVSTGTWIVTVQSVPTNGSISADQTICNGGNPAAFSSDGAGSGDGTVTYQWQSAVSPFSSWGDIASATNATYDAPSNLTVTTQYRRQTVSTLNAIACRSAGTTPVQVTVQSAVTAGSIASAETICYNTTPAAITSTNGTGSGTISYRWDVSTTDAVSGFSDLGNAAATYAPGALTQDTWYRRYTISEQNGVNCESAATSVILKKVQTVPTAGTIGADRTICNNTTTTISTGTAGSGRSGSSITYRWEVSTTSDIAGFSSTGVTTISITTPALTVDTWYRRITIADLDGTLCESSPTTATKVTVQSVPTAGVIEADQTICSNASPATITSNTNGTGNGAITYRWEKSTTNAGSGYSAQAGALSSLSPGTLTATTWYRRYSISTLNSNACESSAATTAVQITVQSTPTAGTITADQTICYNTTPATITSNGNGTGDGTISYRWQSSTTSAVAGFTDNGTVTASFSPGALTQDTWYKRYTVSTLNGVACESLASNVIKVTVQATPGAGSIASDQTICYNTTPTGLTSSSIGTGTGTLSYVWEVSTTNASSGFSTIGGETTSTYSPSALTATSWYRRSTLSTLNGNGCTSVTTSAVQITVRPNFTPGSILTTGETICSNNNPILIDNNVVSSGGDNSITYEWRANGTPIGSTNTSSYDPPATSITTTFTRWAKDATCNTTFAQSTGSWVVTVNNPTVIASLSNNDFVWTGLNGTDWATTTNWLQWNSSSSSYSVPGSYPNANTANVILPATGGCVLNNSVTNGNSLAVNNLTIEASHTFGLNNASASLSVAGTLTVNGTWSTPTSGSTVIFNGAGAQTIPVLAYSNLSTATGGAKTLAGSTTVSRVLTIGASSTLNLSTYTLTLPFVGTPLVNSGTFTASTGKVDFNGAGNQSLAGLSYYDLTTSGSGTKSLLGTTSVGNALALNAGTLSVGANTFTMNGSTLTRTSGSIDASNSSATLVFNNSSALTLPSSVFSAAVNNMTLSNEKVKASSDFTVNGTLLLDASNPNATDGLLDLVQSYGSYANVSSSDGTDTNNDLNSVVLTLGANASTDGTGDVTGKIKRTSLSDGLTYTFGNRNMRITLDENGGSLPSSITVVATKGSEGLHVDKDGTADYTNGSPDTLIGGAAVQRLHQILRVGGSTEVKFTVRLPYDDSELNGNSESNLVVWDHHIPFSSISPQEHGKSSNDATENFVELADHDLHHLSEEGDASFTKYWMISNKETTDTLWLGSTIVSSGSDWSNKSNWSSGAVPSNWSRIVIDENVYASELEIVGNKQALSFEIRPNSTVNGGSGKLTLNGSGQSWVNNGIFNPGTSEIIFNSSDSRLAGISEFYDLKVNAGKTLTIEANAESTILGALNNLGTLDASAIDNTIVYSGDYQSIVQPNGTTPGYFNLTISQISAEAYAVEPINVKGDLLISSGALEMDGNSLEIKGDLINNSSLNSAPLVTMSGTSDQLIGGTSPINFLDLVLTGSDTVSVQNDIVINNILTVDASKILAGGNSNFEFYNSGTPFVLDGSFFGQTSTVKYLASAPTDVTATTYYNLNLSGGTTKNIIGNTVINNDLDIDSDLLDMQTFSLSIGGTPSIASGGTVDADNGEIIFANDNASISLPNAFFNGDVKDMTLLGTENVVLNGDLTITGTLDVVEGDLLLGSNILVMESNSTWTKTNGFLNAQTGSVLFKSASLDPLVLPSETLNNLEFSRAGVIEVTGNLEVAGEFKLTEGTIDVNNHTLKLSGDMIYVDGEVDADNGKVDFNNGSVWNLPSSFFIGDVKKLQVSGAGGIGLARNHKITDSLIMTGGNIDLSGNNLEIGSSASLPGVIDWNTGTIIGPLKRWFAAATNSSIESGIFPVGTSTLNRYAQVNFTQAPEGGYLVIDFKNGMPPGANYDIDLPITYYNDQGLRRYIQNADQSGYWEMTPYNAAGESYEALDNFNYNLALRINNPTSVQTGGVLNNPPGVKLIRAKGFADGSHGDWELAGTYSTFVELNAGEDYVIKSVNVTGFSWFNGGGDNSNPLPVELISFNGLCDESQTTLSWQTASEFNSAYFEVQKSTDGENWRIINTQDAAGNSTELLSYQAIDNSSTEQNAYYRLKQVDENGEENVYDPIFIGCDETTSSIKTYPNPSSNSFQVVVNDKNLTGKATFEMVDTKGAIVATKPVVVSEGVNMILINENLLPGVYFVKLTNGVSTSQIIKHVIK